MNDIITKLINWSEVWALLIPLAVIMLYKPVGKNILYLVFYVLAAFLLNTLSTIMVEFYFSMPDWLKNNNVLYNIHSIARVLFFSLYILTVRKYKFKRLLQLFVIAYLAFVVVNFSILESPWFISSRLFSAESILLLILCLSFFFRSIQDDSETNWLKHPAFLICTGICLYEATSFFIFLFFYPLFEKNPEFGDLTMSIHNVMYVILCLFLAITLYRYRKSKPSNRAWQQTD